MRKLLALLLLLPALASAQLITRVQLVPLSNYVDNVFTFSVGASNNAITFTLTTSNLLNMELTNALNMTSNYLFGLVSGGGISAATATNISLYFATNSALMTSNGLVSFVMTASNNVTVSYLAADITTSNGAVAFTMVASNNIMSAALTQTRTELVNSNGLWMASKNGIATNATLKGVNSKTLIKAADGVDIARFGFSDYSIQFPQIGEGLVYLDATDTLLPLTLSGLTYSAGVLSLGGTLADWSLYPTNVWNSRQGGSTILSNITVEPLTNARLFQPSAPLLSNLVNGVDATLTADLAVPAAGGGSNAWVGGLIAYNNGNQTNLNSSAQLTNAFQISVSAMTFTNPGACLRGEWDFRPHDTIPNTNQFLCWFGTNVFDSGLLVSNNWPTTIKAKIECLNTNSFHVRGEIVTRNGVGFAMGAYTNLYDFVVAGNAFVANVFSVQIASRRFGGLTNTGTRIYFEPGPPR